MRLIPKKSKIGTSIFRGLSLRDILVMIVMILLAFAILLSNLPGKWYVLVFYVVLCAMMLIGDSDRRAYGEMYQLLKFAVSEKTYKNTKKKHTIDKLIPFNDIGDDGIVDYGEYFGAVLTVGSCEFGLLEEYQQNSKIQAFAKALNSLNNTATLQLVKVDRPINYDEISARLFEKITQAKERRESTVKSNILKSRLAQIDDFNNVTPQYRPYYYLVVYDDTRQMVLSQLEMLYQTITNIGLECHQLNKIECANFYKYCFAHNFDERDALEFDGYAAEYVKPQSVKFGTTYTQIDDIYSFTFAISDYPLYVGNAWGAELFNIPNTKVVLTMKPVEKGKAVKRIDHAITEMRARDMPKASEQISQETHVGTMAALIESLQNGNETLLDCTLTITGFNYSKAENALFRKEIYRQITSSGFRVNSMYARQFEGFVASSISRRTGFKSIECGINSESLAAIFPFVFSSCIEDDGICIGYDNYPIILDIWKRGEQHTNSNIVVIGKPGSGKSFFTSTLIANLYSDNVQIFILDPENEYNILCENVGGKYVDVGNASVGRINPLHIFQTLSDDGTQSDPEVVYSAHLRFLENFFKITMEGITSDSLEELNNNIVNLYESRKIKPTTDVSNFTSDQFPTFDDLLAVIDKEITKEKNNKNGVSRLANLERVRVYLEKFATGGRYAQLWNGASTLESNEKFIVFNFQSLFASNNYIVINAQMLLLLRYLEQKIINIREINRNNPDQNIHPIIVIDEGHSFINEKYPVALDFIHNEFKRIRKYNGSMMFLTQNLADILGNQSIVAKTSAIINNSQYSFIFGLNPADVSALEELYKSSGGINDTERNAIATASRGDCFAVHSARERSLFHVEATETVRRLFMERGATFDVNQTDDVVDTDDTTE